MSAKFIERRITVQDGLQIHTRDYPGPGEHVLPIVCLPGITRNSRDFADIAPLLAEHHRVVTIEMRGRGKSEYDTDWRNYDMAHEIGDTLAVLAALGVHEAIFLGASRGAAETMFLGAVRPTVIKGAILVDFGPDIDPAGLHRIANYITDKPVRFTSWAEAGAALKQMDDGQIQGFDDGQWEKFARMLFREEVAGTITIDYDPNLGKALAANMDIINDENFNLWPQFIGLSRVPVLVLRGENSDLLAADTAEEMTRRHPDCKLVTVKDRGHCPFLDEPEAKKAIDDFLAPFH